MLILPLLPINSSLPSTEQRIRAINECEKILITHFEFLTQSIDAEIKDAIHYTLFKVKDRFAMSSAFLIAEELEIPSTQIMPALCALEMLRCSLGTVALPYGKTTIIKAEPQYIDPQLSQEAVLCLLSMASNLILSADLNPEIIEQERIEIAKLFNFTLSPLRIFSDFHSRVKKNQQRYETLNELSKLANPIWEAVGFLFDTIKENNQPVFKNFMSQFGLYIALINAHFKKEPTSRMMDTIKTLESNIIEEAQNLKISKNVLDLISPLAKQFKAHLQ